MKFHMEIRMDNAAFTEDPTVELARLLHKTANHLLGLDQMAGTLLDYNGNNVGHWNITLYDKDESER